MHYKHGRSRHAQGATAMQFILIVGGAMIALLIFGTLYKYYEVRKTMAWRRTPGRIVAARARARKVRTAQTHDRALGGGDHQIRNFAEITYEYHVGGRSYRGSRVSIGEDLGNHDVEGRLARYPVGREVSVFYDPSRPQDAVLESDAPEGVWRTMALFIGVLVLMLLGGTFGFEALVQTVAARLQRPERALPAVALAGMAVFIALVARAAMREAEDARGWPTVDGVIEASGVEALRMLSADSDPTLRTRRMFRSDVVYRYRVGGVDLKGSRLRLGGRFFASFDRLARRDAEAYPVGTRVKVFYNPDNASEAVLDPVAQGLWLAWGLAAVLAAGALVLWLG